MDLEIQSLEHPSHQKGDSVLIKMCVLLILRCEISGWLWGRSVKLCALWKQNKPAIWAQAQAFPFAGFPVSLSSESEPYKIKPLSVLLCSCWASCQSLLWGICEFTLGEHHIVSLASCSKWPTPMTHCNATQGRENELPKPIYHFAALGPYTSVPS